MAIGASVDKNVLDSRAADAVLSVRAAFGKVEVIAKWLANNPKVGDVDPLEANFGYTADEAYLMRVTFEQFEALRTAQSDLLETSRKLTGLEWT